MEKIQKLILPGLILIAVAVLYFSYFAPTDELGSFARLDPNSNAAVPVVVKFVSERGAQRTSDGVIFYVKDKSGKEFQVSTSATLPPGIDDSKSIVITGHLSTGGFHAHGVELRN